ncbi:MAG: hypothetical protein ACYDGM_02830 [Vulcanimicrobiaceae bacterium]
MISRRELIKTGVAGAVVLGLARCAPQRSPSAPKWTDDGYDYRVLDPQQREVVAVIAGVMLAGALPASNAHDGTAPLTLAVRGVDTAVAGLTPSVQAEVQQLFGLLTNPIVRPLATGLWSGWSDAGTHDVTAFLTRWRFSGLVLLRSGYDALHQLVMAGWYGNDAAWPHTGYPGPPKIG